MPDTDAYGGQQSPTLGTETLISVGAASKLLGVSVSTLQRWDREGILPARRTITNQRRYSRAEVLAAL